MGRSGFSSLNDFRLIFWFLFFSFSLSIWLLDRLAILLQIASSSSSTIVVYLSFFQNFLIRSNITPGPSTVQTLGQYSQYKSKNSCCCIYSLDMLKTQFKKIQLRETKLFECLRETNMEEQKKKKNKVTLQWLRCNSFIAIALLQWLRCSSFLFSNSRIFTNKANIFRNDWL